MVVHTVVEGKIPASKKREFEEAFAVAKKEDLPPGLVTSILLKNAKAQETYRIQTVWENQEALEKMRSTTQTPKAVELFRSVGIAPTLEIYEQVDSIP